MQLNPMLPLRNMEYLVAHILSFGATILSNGLNSNDAVAPRPPPPHLIFQKFARDNPRPKKKLLIPCISGTKPMDFSVCSNGPPPSR